MSAKKHILIIDDDLTARTALQMLLEHENYYLYFAESGRQGLKKTLDICPDLVLLDVMMPDLDGFDVCQRLRSNPLVADIPVLMISSLSDAASRLRAFEAGAADMLLKPYNELELKTRVRNITHLNHYRRLQEQAEQLNRLAKYDSLTGLPNRTLLLEQLEQWINHATRHKQVFSIFYLDLDNFKQINETLGQKTGDLLLQQIARRLSECSDPTDLLGRLVGNEFVLLQETQDKLNEQEISSHAEHLLSAVNMPLLFDQHELRLSACIGIALYPNDAKYGEELLKSAETAKARAKLQGKNQYQFFTAQMNFNLLQRLALETQLRFALEHEELRLYYQPLMDLQGEQPRLVGVEALLRWQHPERGLLTPNHFIQIAEQSGLIIDIGEWVLKMACQQGKAWHQQGYPLRVAVNTSSLQYRQMSWLGTVDTILKLTEFAPQYLELEITESLLMEQDQNANEKIAELLQHLRSRGIKLSIDDFGTGYSALSYLRRFQVDTLKIDKSFINDVPHDANDTTLVQAIIAMAHGLHLQVIAEGVEKTEQSNFLKDNGCDIGQGYLFGRPQPAKGLLPLIHQHFSDSGVTQS